MQCAWLTNAIEHRRTTANSQKWPDTDTLGILMHMRSQQSNGQPTWRGLRILYLTNDIEADKKVAVLQSVMGAATYGLFILIAPDNPGETTYKDIVDVLQGHFSPKLIVIAKRFRFHKRNQQGVMIFTGSIRKSPWLICVPGSLPWYLFTLHTFKRVLTTTAQVSICKHQPPHLFL